MSYRQFFDSEAVRSAKDPLTKLLRIIFHRRGVTTDDVVRFHSYYWNLWNRGDQQSNAASTHLNNQRRMLLDTTISWRKFWWLIIDLLRLEVVNMSITIKEKDGSEITYSLTDPIKPDQPIKEEYHTSAQSQEEHESSQ